MATKLVSTLVDDLDGQVLGEDEGRTVRFSLDNDAYEIDLSFENAEKLVTALAPFIEKSRRSRRTGRSSSNSSQPKKAKSNDLSEARAWLKANGHDVPARGRIRGDLMDLYRAGA